MTSDNLLKIFTVVGTPKLFKIVEKFKLIFQRKRKQKQKDSITDCIYYEPENRIFIKPKPKPRLRRLPSIVEEEEPEENGDSFSLRINTKVKRKSIKRYPKRYSSENSSCVFHIQPSSLAVNVVKEEEKVAKVLDLVNGDESIVLIGKC